MIEQVEFKTVEVRRPSEKIMFLCIQHTFACSTFCFYFSLLQHSCLLNRKYSQRANQSANKHTGAFESFV